MQLTILRDNSEKLREIGQMAEIAAIQKKHDYLPVMAANTNVSMNDSHPDGGLMTFKYQKKENDNPTLSQLDSSPQKRVLPDLDPSMKLGEYKDSIPVSDISHFQRSKFSKFSAHDAFYDLMNIEEQSDSVTMDRKPKRDTVSDRSSGCSNPDMRKNTHASRPQTDFDEKDGYTKGDEITYSNRETIMGTRFPSLTDHNGGYKKRSHSSAEREYCFCQCRLI